jgi:transcriptional regulator with XRE-family HTH domain
MASSTLIMTGPQCRAARALVEWTIDEVSERSGVAAAAIDEFERKISDPGVDAKRRLLGALESGGAVFIWENGGGVGVRLKYARRDVRAVNKWESEGGPVGDDDV